MDPADPEPVAPPREAERRLRENAEVLGIPVVLQGGETWFVSALPISARGLVLGGLIDRLQTEEIDLVAASRVLALAEQCLDRSESVEAVEDSRQRLQAARTSRAAAESKVMGTHAEIAFHALRTLYRVERAETDVLVTQRHWGDVMAALNGRDTAKSEHDAALALLARMQAITAKPEGADGAEPPFPRRAASGSDGPAQHSSPAGSARTR